MKLALGLSFLPATALAQAIVVDPPVVVLEEGASARVRLEKAGGTPRWLVTLGTMDGDTLVIGDRRAAGYVLIVDAETAAAVVLPLVGKGNLPTDTAPGAEVSVDIAGRSFGPVVADAKGRADIPVEVPPNVSEATVSSRYPDGRTTVKKVTLPAQPFPVAVLLAPPRLAQGEEKLATIISIDRDGRWRKGGPPPVIETDASLRAGPPTAAGPGRWNVSIQATARAPAATVRAIVDGMPTETSTIEVTAPPKRVAPPPPVVTGPEPSAVSLYVGGASAFGPLVSGLLGAEYVRPLRRQGVRVSLLVAFSSAYGTADSFHGTAVDATLAQVHLAVGARMRFILGQRTGLEATAGAGGCWAHSAISGAASRTATAPFFYGGLALSYALASGGDLLADARWTELRLDETTRIEGNALGATLLFGYRFRL